MQTKLQRCIRNIPPPIDLASKFPIRIRFETEEQWVGAIFYLTHEAKAPALDALVWLALTHAERSLQLLQPRSRQLLHHIPKAAEKCVNSSLQFRGGFDALDTKDEGGGCVIGRNTCTDDISQLFVGSELREEGLVDK